MEIDNMMQKIDFDSDDPNPTFSIRISDRPGEPSVSIESSLDPKDASSHMMHGQGPMARKSDFDELKERLDQLE